jgi:hypothetical protein
MAVMESKGKCRKREMAGWHDQRQALLALLGSVVKEPTGVPANLSHGCSEHVGRGIGAVPKENERMKCFGHGAGCHAEWSCHGA